MSDKLSSYLTSNNEDKGIDPLKKLFTTLAALSMAFFILSSSVILTLRMKWTYALSQPDIVQVEYNLDDATIKGNYDGLIDYMFQGKSAKLSFQGLPMSKEGEIHFAEVKDLFRLAYFGMMISGLLVLILGYFLYKQRNVSFIKFGAGLVLLIPAILAVPILTNFDKTFIAFHELVFSNDYWIFDPRLDPIIRYLPESLFMKNALIILALITLMIGIALITGRALETRLSNQPFE